MKQSGRALTPRPSRPFTAQNFGLVMFFLLLTSSAAEHFCSEGKFRGLLESSSEHSPGEVCPSHQDLSAAVQCPRVLPRPAAGDAGAGARGWGKHRLSSLCDLLHTVVGVVGSLVVDLGVLVAWGYFTELPVSRCWGWACRRVHRGDLWI